LILFLTPSLPFFSNKTTKKEREKKKKCGVVPLFSSALLSFFFSRHLSPLVSALFDECFGLSESIVIVRVGGMRATLQEPPAFL